ncbi:MAG: hypothetical protein ACLQU2_29565 [Candidatus Binataceae bacterium]
MAEKRSETFTESELLDELLVSKRSLQTFAAQVLYDNVRIVVALSKIYNDKAPDYAVPKQFERSFDAVEERLAKVARLELNSERVSDFGKRFESIGPNRREKVRRLYQWTLNNLGIKEYHTPLTAAQRRQLKAVLRKGLEGLEPAEDADFVVAMLSELVES